MGNNAVIIISLEKKTAFPISMPVFLIKPSLATLLKRFIPSFLACASKTTNIPSTMTTAPSIIIPKSTAPKDKRFALIPLKYKSKNANRRDNGIIMATIIVVLQSAINRNTIT